MGEALVSRRGGDGGNKISLDTTGNRIQIIEYPNGTTDAYVTPLFTSKFKLEKIHVSFSTLYHIDSGIPINTDIVLYANKPYVFNIAVTNSQYGASATYTLTMTYDTAGAEAKINVSATHTSLNPAATSIWIMCEALISYIRESFEYKAF